MNKRPNHIRIGAGSGFQGDRLEPAVILASQGELDYLALECLAERTIALAQLRKLADSAAGFDPLLEARMRALLPLAVRHGFRIITNMGAANPLGAGRKVISLAKSLGLAIRVAVVSGDDVLSLLEPGMRTIEARGAALSEYGTLVSANAYFGAEEMLPALASSAQVVVTGRVADPSLFVAPLAHEFKWPLDDWQRLGRATAIGHLLECAGQVTGGYFAEPGLKDVPNLAQLGFPWCDVDADGNGVLGKVAGTGGAITLRTAKEQLLYEVTDPGGYLTPDVVADFTSVQLRQTAADRVSVIGAGGRTRTPTYKVSVGYRAGFVGEGEISYAGARAVERARLAGEIVRERLRDDVTDLRVDLIGMDSAHRTDFAHPLPYEVRLRVAARTTTRELAERVGAEVEALWINGPAGGGGVRRYAQERIGVVSLLLERARVRPKVTLMDEDRETQAA
ncbi:MAG TPA: acyclic terpene utilization AtuA family protein [Burkholderiales bacterium]|nr:acyclic terpene utilization AtuA family protein [Burkholderiales bacterium]